MEANRVNGRPSRLGPSYHDQFAGAYAVIGVLARLLQMAGGAAAPPVEVGLYETGLHVASRDLVGVQLKTQLLGRVTSAEPHGEFSMPGYGAYETADKRWMYLLMLSDAHWLKFCQALQLPQANDEALATLRQRKKAREQVEGVVKEAGAAHPFEVLAARLREAGMGFTEVLPLERVLEAPRRTNRASCAPCAIANWTSRCPSSRTYRPRRPMSARGLPLISVSTRWRC